MNPWICPKCGRVWGPMVTGCGDCNNAPIAMPGTSAPVTPEPFDMPTNYPLPPLPRITCAASAAARDAAWAAQNVELERRLLALLEASK